MFRWICRNKVFSAFVALATLLATALGTIFYYFELRRTNEQDVRERCFKFHEITREAEETYCRTADGGVPANLKVLVDQATNLESEVGDELSSLNYITLAALSSEAWLPYEEVRRYGVRGVELAESENSLIDQYAANLVLGHIEFREFQEKGDDSHLVNGRNCFVRARDMADNHDSDRNRYLLGQLYVIWGMNEQAVGQNVQAAEKFQLSKDEWGKLKHNKTLLKQIEDTIIFAKEGLPTRLPCPRTIAIRQKFDTPQSQLADSDDAPTPAEPLAIDQDTSPGNDIALPDLNTMFDGWKLENKNQLDAVADRLSSEISVLSAKIDADAKPAPITPGPGDDDGEERPSLPPDEPPPPASPPRIEPTRRPSCNPMRDANCYSFIIANRTDYDQQLRVNNWQGDDYLIPAKSQRRYTMDSDRLIIERSDNGERKVWRVNNDFRTWDGAKIAPTFEITDCCIAKAE